LGNETFLCLFVMQIKSKLYALIFTSSKKNNFITLGNLKSTSMKTNSLNYSILFGSFLLLNSFSSIKSPAKDAEICEQTIKYSTNKLLTPSGEEVTASTNITFNPGMKLITVESESLNDGKATFDTVIESVECTFDKKITSGKADYKDYILQTDGTKSPVEIILEAKDGVVSLSSYDEEKKLGLRTTFEKWEIVKD